METIHFVSGSNRYLALIGSASVSLAGSSLRQTTLKNSATRNLNLLFPLGRTAGIASQSTYSCGEKSRTVEACGESPLSEGSRAGSESSRILKTIGLARASPRAAA
jgi:hypothetical protein